MTPYEISINIIKADLKSRGLSEKEIDEKMLKVREYHPTSVIRIADAISRFGSDALLIASK